MGAKVVLTLKDPRPANTVRSEFAHADRRQLCSNVADYFDMLASGLRDSGLDIEVTEEQEAKAVEVAMPKAKEPAKKKTRKKASE